MQQREEHWDRHDALLATGPTTGATRVSRPGTRQTPGLTGPLDAVTCSWEACVPPLSEALLADSAAPHHRPAGLQSPRGVSVGSGGPSPASLDTVSPSC